jgi:GNAT superfamily N-acetyltransferase
MHTSDDIVIRQAGPEDISTLQSFRRKMFQDMGGMDPDRIENSLEPFGQWLRAQMQSGQATGWLARGPLGPVGSALGWIYHWYPSPAYPSNGKVGYLFNVFVDPDHRRRGLARKLVTTCLDWLRESGARKITLHTSEKGRSLYASLGFTEGNEMEWSRDQSQ